MHPGYRDQVARLAIVYRECAQHGYASLDDLVAASERDRGELSYATLSAADMLGGLDWAILADLAASDHAPDAYLRAARRIAPWFPHRADALLHAAPPNGRRSRSTWAADFNAHWGEIHGAIQSLLTSGFATSHHTLDALAVTA